MSVAEQPSSEALAIILLMHICAQLEIVVAATEATAKRTTPRGMVDFMVDD
jgi:hypothetical protein